MNRKFRKLLNEQLQGMTVGDIMETNVITINEDATLEQLEYHHPGYPVVNKENNINCFNPQNPDKIHFRF